MPEWITLSLRVAGLAFVLAFGAVAQENTVRVGIFPEAGPFNVFDEETQSASGAGAEIIQAIAKDAGLAIEWVPIEGSGSNPWVEAIEANQIDLITYPFQMTDARKEQYAFTDPVFTYGEAVVVHKDDPREFTSAEDLAGRSVGVVEGSNFVDIANRVGADTRVGDSLADAIAQVDAGTLDAAMGTAPVVIYRVSEGDFPNTRLPEEYSSDTLLPAGFGVEAGEDELLLILNSGLEKLSAEGAIREISARWGIEDLVAD